MKTKKCFLVFFTIFFAISLGYLLTLRGFNKESNNNFLDKELITVETPLENEVISSPLVIKGKAKGYWFFEASFPILLTDISGNRIAEGYATAEEDWMTEDFIPFSAQIEFEAIEQEKGILILKKANASGLSENDDSIEIPIQF